jgi:hypothetical protein
MLHNTYCAKDHDSDPKIVTDMISIVFKVQSLAGARIRCQKKSMEELKREGKTGEGSIAGTQAHTTIQH